MQDAVDHAINHSFQSWTSGKKNTNRKAIIFF